MKNVITRSISGIAYVLLIVICTLNGYLLFAALCCLLGTFAILELNKMSTVTLEPGTSLFNLIDILTFVSIIGGITASRYIMNVDILLVPFLIFFMFRFISELYIRGGNHLKSLARSALAFFYIAVPLSTLMLLYLEINGNLILAMFIFIWLNDTGAFCVGSLIGRHRLFERISPKKSWEGFFGGLAFCVISAIVFSTCFPQFFSNLSLGVFIGFGIIASIFATFGDLVESLLKRTVGVKDSGTIMPGHGGILDRIDSLLFVAPATYLYLTIVMLF